MKYILVAYDDEIVKDYFVKARSELNTFLLGSGKTVLNNIDSNCSSSTFRGCCIANHSESKSLVFYSHGTEFSITDLTNNSFVDCETSLSDFNIDIFYSVACETAKGALKEEIIAHSNRFFGYNSVSYVPVGGSEISTFIDCDNFCIKEMISNSHLTNSELISHTENFFKDKIKKLVNKKLIVEAALLMHNKEAVEIH